MNKHVVFLSNNEFPYNYRSGPLLTDSCLTFLQDKILEGFDEGLMTDMIPIDLQNEFNSIKHDITYY